ncbi:MAG: MBL fold metallo-hydrolase [Planctomycetota bacterium]|nr:MBL fold metallo-hydrolase [Planctomycetota bacterium]
MSRHRIATSVLLTRGEGEGLEVYLARRNPKLRFFGGYWAFLGGTVDPEDHDGERDAEIAHARCALRELFEEVGVVPTELEGHPSRDDLLAGNANDAFRAALDRVPEVLDQVHPFGRLTTPSFAPVRYRTRFVQVALPANATPTIDEGELVEGGFFRPREVLETWRNGGMLIAPPVVYLLELAASCADMASFLTLAGERTRSHEEGRLHRIRNTPGVLMAPLKTPTLPPATTTNAYVVGERDLYVIDPATYDEEERARLYAFLDELVEEGRTLRGVIPTHHHHDHVGSVQEVAERYSVPVLAHPETLARLPHAPRDPRQLVDGDELDLGASPDGTGGWKLTAYHTPGHDRGHLVLVENRYHAALAGDLCSTVSTIVIDPPEGHLATYLASLRRMLEVPMGVLYPAHGPAHRNGHQLITHYLEHRTAREEKLVAQLDHTPRSENELVALVYDDVTIPEVLPLAARSLRAGLEKLEEEGRASRSIDGWLRV